MYSHSTFRRLQYWPLVSGYASSSPGQRAPGTVRLVSAGCVPRQCGRRASCRARGRPLVAGEPLPGGLEDLVVAQRLQDASLSDPRSNLGRRNTLPGACQLKRRIPPANNKTEHSLPRHSARPPASERWGCPAFRLRRR